MSISLSQEEQPGRGQRVSCESAQLPFQDRVFSMVVLHHVIGSGEEPELTEAVRVLARSGVLLLLGLNRMGWRYRTQDDIRRLPGIAPLRVRSRLEQLGMTMQGFAGAGPGRHACGRPSWAAAWPAWPPRWPISCCCRPGTGTARKLRPLQVQKNAFRRCTIGAHARLIRPRLMEQQSLTERENRVVIYTDGACSGNPGPGGWGSVMMYNGHRRELSGGEKQTTNNRMELMAVIRALETLKRPCDVVIHTDSTYVMKGMTEWLAQWKRRNWSTASKQPVKNVELWQRLEEAIHRHDVHWRWVRGHSGVRENERADELARLAIPR